MGLHKLHRTVEQGGVDDMTSHTDMELLSRTLSYDLHITRLIPASSLLKRELVFIPSLDRRIQGRPFTNTYLDSCWLRMC